MAEATPSGIGPAPQVGAMAQRDKSRRIWARKPVFVATAVVIFGIGYAVGNTASSSAQNSLSQARSQLASTRASLNVTRNELTSEQAKVQAAQTQASQADVKAQAKYASQEAALAGKERTVAQEEQAVKALEGRLQASSISADGVYVVGRDIKAGTWHTPGDGGQNSQACYYATLNSTSTSDISDNNNFDGPETINLSGAHAFQISGPCTWYRIGS